jgi:hypothetical protein
MGVGFLLLAIANLTQMKLGTFSCGSSFTWAVVVGLFIFTYLSLFLFIVSSISDYKKARVRSGIGCEIMSFCPIISGTRKNNSGCTYPSLLLLDFS